VGHKARYESALCAEPQAQLPPQIPDSDHNVFFLLQNVSLSEGNYRAANCLAESSLMSGKPVALTLWASATELLALVCPDHWQTTLNC